MGATGCPEVLVPARSLHGPVPHAVFDGERRSAVRGNLVAAVVKTVSSAVTTIMNADAAGRLRSICVSNPRDLRLSKPAWEFVEGFLSMSDENARINGD